MFADIGIFVAIGLIAQLVDGALGMAYGLISTSFLLAIGTPPAVASAIVTTGLAGGSHAWHRNIDWRLFRRLALAGVMGGVLGAYVLRFLPGPPGDLVGPLLGAASVLLLVDAARRVAVTRAGRYAPSLLRFVIPTDVLRPERVAYHAHRDEERRVLDERHPSP